MPDYGAMLGALAGSSAGNMPDDEQGTTLKLSPELYDKYMASQKDVNPIGANNGLPEGNATGIDPDIAKQDLATIQAPNQVQTSPDFLKQFSSQAPQSYSTDFLHQLVNSPTPSGQATPQSADEGIEVKSPDVTEEAPSASEKAPKAPTVLDFGQGELGSVSGLKKAQDEADSNRKQANFFAGLDLITAGLNHASPVAQQMYAQQLKDANIPVDKYLQQLEMEKHDPNSPISKGFKDYLKTFGLDVRGDFSAADADKLLPNVLKAYEADATRTAQKENLAYKYNELKAIQDIKSGEKSDANAKKDEQAQDKAYSDLRNKLETFRGNQAAQQASKDVLSADKALKLVQLKDPNSLTTQDLRLLYEEMAKIATGGVPGEHGVTALMPDSYRQKLAEIQNFLTNKPTDAQAGEYIKKNIKYLQDMRDTAQGTLNNFRTNIAKGYRNRVKSEDYKEALTDYNLAPQAPEASQAPQTPAQPKSLGGYAQQMGIAPQGQTPTVQAPPSPQDLSAQIQQAKAHGYSDKEIQDFLTQKHGQ